MRNNLFSEQFKKIELSVNNYKRKQSTDSIGTYGYGARKDLVSKKEKNKYNNVITQCIK